MTHTEQLRAALEEGANIIESMTYCRDGCDCYHCAFVAKSRAALAAAPTEQAAVPSEPFVGYRAYPLDMVCAECGHEFGHHNGMNCVSFTGRFQPQPTADAVTMTRQQLDDYRARIIAETVEKFATAPAAPESKDRRAGYIEGLEAAAKACERKSEMEWQANDPTDYHVAQDACARLIRALIDKEPG